MVIDFFTSPLTFPYFFPKITMLTSFLQRENKPKRSLVIFYIFLLFFWNVLISFQLFFKIIMISYNKLIVLHF